jgi:hypothetical protein
VHTVDGGRIRLPFATTRSNAFLFAKAYWAYMCQSSVADSP